MRSSRSPSASSMRAVRSWTRSWSSSDGLLDLALGGNRAGLAPGHEHDALELGHQHAVLVEHAGVDADRAAVGLRARPLDLEHLGLAEQRVAVEHRRRVLELLR